MWDRGPEHKGSRQLQILDFILRPGSTGTENSRLTLQLQMRLSVHCEIYAVSHQPHRWGGSTETWDAQLERYCLHRPSPSPEAQGRARSSRERSQRSQGGMGEGGRQVTSTPDTARSWKPGGS